jgi:hypothetical protein
VAIPWPGRGSFELIQSMAAGTPVWVKPTSFNVVESELGDALQMGGAGLWLDERVFARADPVAFIETLRTQVHNS